MTRRWLTHAWPKGVGESLAEGPARTRSALEGIPEAEQADSLRPVAHWVRMPDGAGGAELTMLWETPNPIPLVDGLAGYPGGLPAASGPCPWGAGSGTDHVARGRRAGSGEPNLTEIALRWAQGHP